MRLYSVDDNGDLIKIDKLDFIDCDAYVVDDGKTVFLWIGLNTSQKKKDFAANTARQLESERGDTAKILIMKQGRERLILSL